MQDAFNVIFIFTYEIKPCELRNLNIIIYIYICVKKIQLQIKQQHALFATCLGNESWLSHTINATIKKTTRC